MKAAKITQKRGVYYSNHKNHWVAYIHFYYDGEFDDQEFKGPFENKEGALKYLSTWKV